MSKSRISPEQWEAVGRYLANHGYSLDKAFEIRQLSGGSANFNYLISINGQKAVLRCPPEGPLPPGANDVSREYKVLSRLGEAFPPAPKGLIFCEDDSVISSSFCVSEFREGICIGRHLPAELDLRPQVGAELSELLVSTLAKLHKVDVEQVGLTDLGKADGFLERQIAGWYKRAGRVLSEGQLQSMALVRDWLTAHLPKARFTTLVHNDFKLDNMLIDPASLRVQGVVDWDMCTLGDPFFELAILLAYWGGKSDHALYAYQCRMPCESDGWWTRREVFDHYLALTGFSLNEADLSFYWVLTQYRSVVVYAQLKAMFERSGQRPAALTSEECDFIETFVEQMSTYLASNLGSLPDILGGGGNA